MLRSKEFDKAISESNTYVIPVFTGPNYSGIKFKKFTVPEEYRKNPTWYFYNKLDFFSCGGQAFPYEMYKHLEDMDSTKKSTNIKKRFKSIFKFSRLNSKKRLSWE